LRLRRGQLGADSGGEGSEIDGGRPHFQIRNLCQADHVLDEAAHALRRAADALQIAAAVFAQYGAAFLVQRLGEAFYGAQRRTQVVRYGIAEALQIAVGDFQVASALVHPPLQIVHQAQQRIFSRLLFHAQAQRLDAAADLVGQLFEQAGFLGVEDLVLGRRQRQHAPDPARHAQREADHRGIRHLACQFAPGREARIVDCVANDGNAILADRGAGDATAAFAIGPGARHVAVFVRHSRGGNQGHRFSGVVLGAADKDGRIAADR